jgi:hypothetical protein
MIEDVETSSSESGMALPLVLWLAVLLSGLIIGLLSLGREDVARYQALQDNVKARHLADGLAMTAIAKLVASNPAARPYNEIQPQTAKIDNVDAIIVVRDACGKLDINTGSRQLIAKHGRSIGLSQPQVKDILDDLSTRSRAIASLSQLRYVGLMDGEQWQDFSEDLTVYCPNGALDPKLASQSMLTSLHDLTGNLRLMGVGSSPRKYYEINVSLSLGRTQLNRSLWISVEDSPHRPYKILGQMDDLL